MYGILCAHCGNKELFHNLGDDLELPKNNNERGLSLDNGWSLQNYGEEFDGVDVLHKHKRGYTKSFDNCPGFSYSKKISNQRLISEALGYPYTIFFLDEKLAEQARKAIEKIEAQPRPHLLLCSTTYIIVGRDGISRCYVGD